MESIRKRVASLIAQWGLLVIGIVLIGMMASLVNVSRNNTELLEDTERKAATIDTLRDEVEDLRLLVCVTSVQIQGEGALPDQLADEIERRCSE